MIAITSKTKTGLIFPTLLQEACAWGLAILFDQEYAMSAPSCSADRARQGSWVLSRSLLQLESYLFQNTDRTVPSVVLDRIQLVQSNRYQQGVHMYVPDCNMFA